MVYLLTILLVNIIIFVISSQYTFSIFVTNKFPLIEE